MNPRTRHADKAPEVEIDALWQLGGAIGAFLVTTGTLKSTNLIFCRLWRLATRRGTSRLNAGRAGSIQHGQQVVGFLYNVGDDLVNIYVLL